MDDQFSEVQAAAELAIASVAPKSLPGFQPVILLPPAFSTERLEPDWKAELPDHIRQAVTLEELESFIQYVKKFKTHSAQIFAAANDLGARLIAILDYHETGGKDGKPGRMKHTATYAPKYSEDFLAWSAINGKPMTQTAFLDHIRKWGDTITSHTDADMVEIVSSLDFKTNAQFSSHVERTTGGRKLLFEEKVEGSAQSKRSQVTVPDSMKITLPIFVSGKVYEMGLDILYRPQGGNLHIIVEMKRPHLIVRQAVKDIIEDVKVGTDLDPFFGGAVVS